MSKAFNVLTTLLPWPDHTLHVAVNRPGSSPYLLGAAAQVHWGLPDPTDETEPTAARRAFAETYEALATRVDALLAPPLETLDPADLRTRAQAIHG